MSEFRSVSGHALEIGDRVRMNIEWIGGRDLDGIETTDSGFNYWKYMCQHPFEIYTVEDFDFESDEMQTTYVLSGAMAGNNWYANELIAIPTPKTIFETIKAMTDKELARLLAPLYSASEKTVLRWLNEKHNVEYLKHMCKLEEGIEQ